MTKKRDMKDALINSLEDEEKAVEARFKKADKFFESSSSTKKINPPSAEERTIKDGFSMPVNDYSLIDEIKNKCLKAGVATNKSEILRGGLHVLAVMPIKNLLKIMDSVEKLKVGKRARQS